MAVKTWEDVKDPDEVKRFGVKWTDELGDADIVTSTWIIQSGTVTFDDDSYDNAVAIDGVTHKATWAFWSAGTVGETCVIVNRITTTAGETLDQTGKLKIKVE